MHKLLEKAYSASPVWLQQLGINAFGWYWTRRRLGPVYERTWREYVDREAWPPERLQEFVEARLRELVRRAYREVPFYRDTFRAHGISEGELELFRASDLARLPLLEKSTVRADSAQLLTQAARRHPPAHFATSGTTGTPIRAYWTSAVHQHNIAVREARSFRWAGTSYRRPRSMIGGRLVVPKAESSPPFWRYNRWEQQLYLSAFHISAAHIRDYVAALNRFRPETMTGYASANFFLARLIEEAGLEVHSPKAIITGSERLEPHMRELLQRVYRTRAYEEYGSVENCALATECERGRLHVSPDFGHVEILRGDGTPAPAGETGEIVATGFANTDQIFIRYRTGDLAAWSAEKCPCGRASLPVIADLLGRQEDVVVTADGREMVRFHGIFLDLPEVVEGQVVQESVNHFLINVVINQPSAATDATIRRRMETRLGADISLEINHLQEIPREANGKFRAVISRVKRTPSAGPAPLR